MENRERGIGWPLGLGSMYMRLRLVDGLPIAATDHTRSSFCIASSSFASFSSSNLDTESTASFFQDKSKSLGRIMGIRPRNNRRSELCSRDAPIDRSETTHRLSSRSSSSEHEGVLDIEMCDGICIPLCLYAKINKNNKNSSKLSMN